MEVVFVVGVDATVDLDDVSEVGCEGVPGASEVVADGAESALPGAGDVVGLAPCEPAVADVGEAAGLAWVGHFMAGVLSGEDPLEELGAYVEHRGEGCEWCE